MAGSVFGGGTPGDAVSSSDRPEDPRNLITGAFVPNIAVHISTDAKELVKDKGFEGGLWELLRPFGEHVQGKVTVRDSVGAGKTFENFAVRFVQLGDGMETQEVGAGPRRSGEGRHSTSKGEKPSSNSASAQRARTGGDITSIESLVDRHLTYAEDFPSMDGDDYFGDGRSKSLNVQSPFYTLYLRRLLSGLPLAPHETFSHPVACVIAISSRCTSPIETLRKLYNDTDVGGEKRLPPWVEDKYLRYYVLVHDEERDDITKSMTLFEQMKRHFGAHCHLLRLRSSQCVATDDDSVQLPRCEWLTAAEELSEIQAREIGEYVDDSFPCIFESDTTAIKTFIREMVTQSIVPTMERSIAVWNDQVASRRRGLSGKFMKMTSRWGLGTSSRNSSSGSSSNYDALQGFYRPDAPEAVMRKLADYAFMLRDWKLAQSTYELLRSDFFTDKAWKYHAASNEMAAVSTLLVPTPMSSRTRSETVDQMLEMSYYSYVTRCGNPYGAVRSLCLGMELLRLRPGSATEDAATWGAKIVEYKLTGVVGDALVKERIAACYASKKGAGSGHLGMRTRKSAMWSIQAADSWLTLGKPSQSKQRLDEAKQRYSTMTHEDSLSHWPEANKFLKGLQREVQLALYPESGIEGPGVGHNLLDDSAGEESEAFDSRPHRRSLMAPPGSAPLNGTLEGGDPKSPSDQFE